MFRLIVCVLALLALTNAYADEASKATKMTELMKLKGLYEVIEQQLDYVRLQAQQIGPTILRQTRLENPGLGPETDAQLESAYQEFLYNVRPSWTIDEVVALWHEAFGGQVSESDLDRILAYYRSPVGRKDIEATGHALPRWTTFIAEHNQRVMEQETSKFVMKLDEIVNSSN